MLAFYFYFWSKRIARIRSPHHSWKDREKQSTHLTYHTDMLCAVMPQTWNTKLAIEQKEFPFLHHSIGWSKLGFCTRTKETNKYIQWLQYAFYFIQLKIIHIERWFSFRYIFSILVLTHFYAACRKRRNNRLMKTTHFKCNKDFEFRFVFRIRLMLSLLYLLYFLLLALFIVCGIGWALAAPVNQEID